MGTIDRVCTPVGSRASPRAHTPQLRRPYNKFRVTVSIRFIRGIRVHLLQKRDPAASPGLYRIPIPETGTGVG